MTTSLPGLSDESWDIDDMASMMLKMEREPQFRADIIEKGLKRVKMFSWRKTAEQLLDVYNSL